MWSIEITQIIPIGGKGITYALNLVLNGSRFVKDDEADFGYVIAKSINCFATQWTKTNVTVSPGGTKEHTLKSYLVRYW
jgi:hypothetical protein